MTPLRMILTVLGVSLAGCATACGSSSLPLGAPPSTSSADPTQAVRFDDLVTGACTTISDTGTADAAAVVKHLVEDAAVLGYTSTELDLALQGRCGTTWLVIKTMAGQR